VTTSTLASSFSYQGSWEREFLVSQKHHITKEAAAFLREDCVKFDTFTVFYKEKKL